MDQNSFTPPPASIQQAEVPTFAPTSTPPVVPQTPPSPPPVMPSVLELHGGRNTALFIVLCVVALGVLGVAYAYVEKIGLFSNPPYKEESFMTELGKNLSKIKSGTTEFTVSLDSTVARDKDAFPFVVKNDNAAELAQRYQNDYDRARDVSKLLNLIIPRGTYQKINGKYTLVKPTVNFKSDLSAVVTSTSAGANINIVDPVTKKTYDYKATEGGTNFALTVTFETDAAIQSIRKSSLYGYGGVPLSATSTLFDGKKVTFTKNSPSYVYVSSRPPKPILEELGQLFNRAPTDMKAQGGFTVSTNLKEDKSIDSDVVFDFSGSFGDMTIAMNINARKKGELYYVRINKMPSFLGDLSTYKNKWIKIDLKELANSSSSYGSAFASIAKRASSTQQESLKARDKMISLLVKVLAIADEEKLIRFKNPPHSESLNGKQVYRYDIGFNKEKILPFYQKVVDTLSQDPDFKGISFDQGLVDYLKGSEFNETFDYYDKNISFSYWVGGDGMPVSEKMQFRVVPPDTAKQFKDKQVMINFVINFSNINKNSTIDVPADSTPLEDIMGSAVSAAQRSR